MTGKRRGIAVIAIMTALIFAVQTTAVCATSLGELNNEIKEKQQELKEQRKQAGNLSKQVDSMEKTIKAKEANIKKLESAMSQAEKDKARITKELKAAEAKVDSQDDDLNSRLRNMYKNDTVGFLDVLLGSASFSEFLTNLDMVEKVFSNDKELLEKLKVTYDEINAKKKQIEKLTADLTESKQIVEEEKKVLSAEKKEYEKKLGAVLASATETEEELAQMEEESAYLESLLQQQGSSSTDKNDSSSSSGSNSGSTDKPSGETTEKPKPSNTSMAFPAPGYKRVSSEFGYRIHPITGKKRLHAGIDLASNGGNPIVAARDGKVLYVKHSKTGYGKHLLVDHGNGVATLYAHCSAIHVKTGEKVSRGERIASIGTTGSSTGNHLHFEVRLDGKPVNPRPYIF